MDVQAKPDIESITGSPPIVTDQKVKGKNPRSTVGTVTEIYDYFRLLYSKIGIPYSLKTGKPLQTQTPEVIVDSILTLPEGTVVILPVIKNSKGEHRKELIKIRKQGYLKIKIYNEVYNISSFLPKLDKNLKYSIDIILDTYEIKKNIKDNLLNKIKNNINTNNRILLVELIELSKKKKNNFI